nr:hypothetical protein [Saprospiraceae bacterium]
MKKTLLLLIAFALFGLLFFACEKDQALKEEKGTPIVVEQYSTERSQTSCCNSSLNYCSTCPSGYCCYRVELSFADPNVTDLLSKYKYCKSWDAYSTCEIDEGGCYWPGLDGDLCVGTNYICVPASTGFSIFNTSGFATIIINVFYPASSTNTVITNHPIDPRETAVFENQSNCNARECI